MCRQQILDDLVLAVDRDPAAAGQRGHVNPMPAPAQTRCKCRRAACLRASAARRRPSSRSRSTVPCSRTPARTRSMTCSRVRFSMMTESIPARPSRCPSISPAAPAPTIPTCVRITAIGHAQTTQLPGVFCRRCASASGGRFTCDGGRDLSRCSFRLQAEAEDLTSRCSFRLQAEGSRQRGGTYPRSREARSSTISAPAPAESAFRATAASPAALVSRRMPMARDPSAQYRISRSRVVASDSGTATAASARPRLSSSSAAAVRSGDALPTWPSICADDRTQFVKPCQDRQDSRDDISPRRCVGEGLPALQRSPGRAPGHQEARPPCRPVVRSSRCDDRSEPPDPERSVRRADRPRAARGARRAAGGPANSAVMPEGNRHTREVQVNPGRAVEHANGWNRQRAIRVDRDARARATGERRRIDRLDHGRSRGWWCRLRPRARWHPDSERQCDCSGPRTHRRRPE